MLGWLFKSKSIQVEQETNFGNLPIGQEFQKMSRDDAVYVKTSNQTYETIQNSYHCIKWYRVYEDFMVVKV